MNNTCDSINSQGTSLAPPPAVPGKLKYQGVDGWLLLFCLSLTLFNPIAGLYSIIASYKVAFQFLAKFPHLIIVTTIYAILTLALVSFGFYTGRKLWAVKTDALKTAKKYLWRCLAYVIAMAILPYFSGLNSTTETNAVITLDAVGRVILGATYIALWFGYLNKSERVRNTYQS